MKIIGFVYNDGQTEMVLKGDSCLLNGRKPLFMPEWTNELAVTECIILRVSRLGKEIASKYASRYFNAIAYGADFIAMDVAREAKAQGKPWTKALAFDYSLAIGEWMEAYPQQCSTDGHWQSDRAKLFTPEGKGDEDDSTKLMTIIYPNARHLAENIVAEDGSIGIRITNEPFSKALCAQLKRPLVSTSANISGHPTAHFFHEIEAAILEGADYVCQFRREDDTPHEPSTIIKVNADGTFRIIRE